MIVISWEFAVGFIACLLAAIVFIIKDGFVINEVRRERDEWRRKYREQCNTRTSEAEQDAEREADRRRACEIEFAELKAKLKAAGILADGWRKAAGKGCAK